MKTDNRLIEWAIQETKTKYADQLSILLEYDAYRLEEDRHVRFVSHMIADTKEYTGLARTVLIDGIGHDFFQLSWDSFEQDAQAKGYFLCILADANIIYSRSEEDRQRFLHLRETLKANLADRDYMYLRGLEWIDNAMDVYKSMQFASGIGKIRKAAGFVADYLATAVACLNQTYFKTFSHMAELQTMPCLPEGLIDQWKLLVSTKSTDELIALCREMIQSTRTLFASNDRREKKQPAPDYAWLAEWYQECSYYFRRIYHFCAQQDTLNAFQESCGLQTDLDDIAAAFSLDGLDILTHFDAKNLAEYTQQVKQAEQTLVSAIASAHVELDAYASVDDFLAKNS